MQVAGPSGFYNVPVTKFLILFVGTCSVLSSILDMKTYFHLQLIPHITVHHQFWRLITSHCAFGSSGELLFATLLLYFMRVIERQYGSAKYIAFIFLSAVTSTLLELGALVSGSQLGLRSIPGGSYALIFSILYQYHRLVPATYQFRIFGITLNDKCYVYLLVSQLFIAQGISTMVPCICGLMAGALYRSDIGNIKQWRFPRSIRSLSSRFVHPSLASAPTARANTTLPYEGQRATGIAVESIITSARTLRNRRQAIRDPDNSSSGDRNSMRYAQEYIDTLTGQSPGSSLEAPAPEHFVVLMTMFPDHPRETVTRALSSAQNNLNRAVEIMLNTPAPSTSNESGPSSSSRPFQQPRT